MSTIENNKQIALFMGGKLNGESTLRLAQNEIWLPIHGICRYDTVEIGKGKTMRYHKSFDWLMPVIEKINGLDECHFLVSIMDAYTTIEWCDYQENENDTEPNTWQNIAEHGLTNLEATYSAICKYIEWYNQSWH